MHVAALYIRAMRTQWLIVAIVTLLGGAGLGFAASRQTAVYRADVHLLVSFVPENNGSLSGMSRLMQRRVKTYSSMMNSRRLTQPVIESLGLPYTPEHLSDTIVASSPLNTLAIDVAVTDTVASRAADIANALAAELAKIADREEPSEQFPAATRISVVRAASVAASPLPVRWQLHLAAGALAGFAIGLGLAVLRCHSQDGLPVGVDLRNAWSSAMTRWRARWHEIRSRSQAASHS